MVCGSRMLRSLSPYLVVESMKSKDFRSSTHQLLDSVQANKMQKTLHHFGLFETPELKDGDLLPPCYHFAYFTPKLAESQLSADGADTTFNPGGSFTRRMWAGGYLKYVESNPLRIGEVVEEVTTLDHVESKMTRDKKPMIVVQGRKEYRNQNGVALTDHRSWLFREPDTTVVQKLREQVTAPKAGTLVGAVKASEITLFRFSALTFNSHKIQ